jgi:FHS family glucose/mannose:H+ symporter-like MFS transporter
VHVSVLRRPTSLLFAGFVLTGIVNTILGPILPWLASRWSLSDAAAGSLFSVQFAGGLAGGGVSGLLVTRFGAGVTMGMGHLLMAIGLAMLAGGGLGAGLVGMGLSGLGLGFVIPTTNLMAAQLAPERAASALGAVNLCWGFGAAIWPLGVAAFAARGGLTLALVLVCFLLLAMAAWAAPVSFPKASPPKSSSGGPQALAFGRLAAFGICIALYSGIEAAFGGWITEYTRRLAGAASTDGWEIAASAFWAGLTAGRAAVAVWLIGRWETAALFTGLSVVAAAIGLLLVTPGVYAVMATAALCGVGLSPVFPVTVAALSREFSPAAAGPMVALGSAGAGTLPLLVGAISDRTGSLTSGLAALIICVGILAALQVMQMRK